MEAVGNAFKGREERSITQPLNFLLSPVDRTKQYKISTLTTNSDREDASYTLE